MIKSLLRVFLVLLFFYAGEVATLGGFYKLSAIYGITVAGFVNYWIYLQIIKVSTLVKCRLYYP